MLMERIMVLFKNETKSELRIEIYYILAHLIIHGKKEIVYKWYMQENLL